MIKRKDDVISPVVNIDGILKYINKGFIEIEDAAEEIQEIYKKSIHQEMKDEARKFTSKEYILENVQYQLVNKEKNEEKLKMCPFKDFLDLAAVYRVIAKNYKREKVSYIINIETMKKCNISLEELDNAARKNTEKKAGFYVLPLATWMYKNTGLEEFLHGDMSVYIMTNDSNINGATILMYKENLDLVAEILNDDVFIAPSSINEIIVTRVGKGREKAVEMHELMRETNNTQVEMEDILGYSIYRYRRGSQKIEIVKL